jgi:O-succinylbenzoate synthase
MAMYQAYFKKYTLQFNHPSGTSRGILTEKVSWFIFLTDEQHSGINGIGECGPLKGLSIDDRIDYKNKLAEVCKNPNNYMDNTEALEDFPSIRFGLEMALLDYKYGGRKILFPSLFTEGKDSISINGLVWMGSYDAMLKQVREKIEAGFKCIKLKIGAINFEEELNLIRSIRNEFSPSQVEIRVDANGAFKPEEALEKLKRLSEFQLHSIEQPIKQNQLEAMAELCVNSPFPIVLDEELIGIKDLDKKQKLLEKIKPHYIILKPSLLGGFEASEEWIVLASQNQIGWWVTSALESNIGLNAIAQWTYTLENKLPQGLGTGQLYSNNFQCPLNIKEDKLFFNPKEKWDLKPLLK